jgi:hypothetical protein
MKVTAFDVLYVPPRYMRPSVPGFRRTRWETTSVQAKQEHGEDDPLCRTSRFTRKPPRPVLTLLQI